MMIPSSWRPWYRDRDGELTGYLDGTEPAVTPRTVFGYALAAPTTEAEARRVLEARGLSSLGERWQLTLDSGERVPVVIMSAYADQVVVVETEYGYYGPDSDRHRLTAPTGDRLAPAD